MHQLAYIDPGLIGQYGFPVFVAVFLLWYTFKQNERRDKDSGERELRMSRRLDAAEDHIKSELVHVIDRNTRAMESSARAASGVRDVLRTRPCLQDADVPSDEFTTEQAKNALKRNF